MNTISNVFLVLLVTLWPSQILAQNLITSACDHTLYKELCRKTLESDPASRAATNFEGLDKVALKHATSAATQIRSKVTNLLNGSSSKAIKGALKIAIRTTKVQLDNLRTRAVPWHLKIQ
ncbi:hypothetical protein SLA2020_276300 [Shorea laevis]